MPVILLFTSLSARYATEVTNVIWMDNFSKFYAIAIQTLGSGAFKDCLWTGQGLHVYVGQAVDTSIQPGLFAMPLCLNLRAQDVMNLMKQIEDTEGDMYFENSICYRYGVNRIPLKPEVDVKQNAKLAAILAESRDGLTNFEGTGILPENIGSNRGLLLILKDHFSVPLRPGHYSFLCVDCNIFMRCLKVIMSVVII